MFLITDANWGTSILYLKRGKNLVLVSSNMDSSVTLDCSVASDEFTLNILYSKQSYNFGIIVFS